MPNRQLDLFQQLQARPDILIRESKRARHLSIQVSEVKGIEVVVPPRTRPHEVRQFVEAHRDWIEHARFELDLTGPARLVLSCQRADTCSDCHQQEIEGVGRAEDTGIALLRLPGLDLETLEARGFPVGEWPEYADADDAICMDLLLQAEPGYAMEQDSGFMKGYEDTDPHSYDSGFKSISKTTCVDCHTRDSAGEGRLTCHNHHIFSGKTLQTSALQ